MFRRGSAAAALLVLVCVFSAQAATTPDKPKAVVSIGKPAMFDSRCGDAYRAVRWYRQKYDEHRALMGQKLAPPVEQAMGCKRLRERAAYWIKAAKINREAAAKWFHYHYAWREWLPRNWYLVGSCETGYGGDPNFEHSNSSFTSAFGISWAEYNADAAHMGAPPWHVRHTPRDQYLAALGHYDRFGDGWTCPGP